MSSNHAPHAVRRGYALGLLGVCVFALTLPMTRLATGTPEAPQLAGRYIAGAHDETMAAVRLP